MKNNNKKNHQSILDTITIINKVCHITVFIILVIALINAWIINSKLLGWICVGIDWLIIIVSIVTWIIDDVTIKQAEKELDELMKKYEVKQDK